MGRYKVSIMGVSESRWTGSGKTVSINHIIIYIGRSDNQHTEGVAIIMSKESARSMIEWEPVNERLIRARFNSHYAKTTVIQCYAPTNDAEDDIKEAYYEALLAQINKTPQHDVLLVIGDQNAKVGSNNSQHERSMGKEGCGTMNENGERLTNLCSSNGLVIGGTLFKHKDIHKITWYSPNNRDKYQIDHVIINGKWRRSLLDTRSYRGADVNSDHCLVVVRLKLKLKKTLDDNKTNRKIIDIKRLNDCEVQRKFTTELRNIFKELENLDQDEEPSVENSWQKIKQVYQQTAEKTIGYRKKLDKKWLSQDTWKTIEERTKLKGKVLNTKSPRLKENLQKAYSEKDKEVKRSARKDKRAYIDKLADDAEKAVLKVTLTLHIR